MIPGHGETFDAKTVDRVNLGVPQIEQNFFLGLNNIFGLRAYLNTTLRRLPFKNQKFKLVVPLQGYPFNILRDQKISLP